MFFLAMKYVKSQLCNKMCNQCLNDRFLTFIDRDVLDTINNDFILTHFQQMNKYDFLYKFSCCSYFKYNFFSKFSIIHSLDQNF